MDPFKRNQQFPQISPTRSLQYLAIGLITLSLKEGSHLPLEVIQSLGGNASFDYGAGMFLIWSTREAG